MKNKGTKIGLGKYVGAAEGVQEGPGKCMKNRGTEKHPSKKAEMKEGFVKQLTEYKKVLVTSG